jgi:hypothetical protein
MKRCCSQQKTNQNQRVLADQIKYKIFHTSKLLILFGPTKFYDHTHLVLQKATKFSMSEKATAH